MANTGLVKCSLYTASDAGEMASMLADAFALRDPPALAVGITAQEFEDFVHMLCRKVDAEGLTIVARSVDTGELVGALLAEDSTSPLPDDIGRLSPKFDPIFDLLSQLELDYRHGADVQPGESMHLFLLGVAHAFGGRGVAQQLVAECVANGARQGYRLAVTEATSRRSQHVFRKQGFADRVQRSYGDHRFDGRAFFESIADQGGPILMDRRLAAES
jgi:ribosomal protein S18 acetylase RimI-like enzyme